MKIQHHYALYAAIIALLAINAALLLDKTRTSLTGAATENAETSTAAGGNCVRGQLDIESYGKSITSAQKGCTNNEHLIPGYAPIQALMDVYSGPGGNCRLFTGGPAPSKPTDSDCELALGKGAKVMAQTGMSSFAAWGAHSREHNFNLEWIPWTEEGDVCWDQGLGNFYWTVCCAPCDMQQETCPTKETLVSFTNQNGELSEEKVKELTQNGCGFCSTTTQEWKDANGNAIQIG